MVLLTEEDRVTPRSLKILFDEGVGVCNDCSMRRIEHATCRIHREDWSRNVFLFLTRIERAATYRRGSSVPRVYSVGRIGRATRSSDEDRARRERVR